MIFENPHTEYTMEVSGTFLSVSNSILHKFREKT